MKKPTQLKRGTLIKAHRGDPSRGIEVAIENLCAELDELRARVEQLEAQLEGRPADRIGQGLMRLRARARGMEGVDG